MNKKLNIGKSLLRIDFILLFAVMFLMFLGIMFIYSSGISSAGVNLSNEYIKQIIWVSSGMIILLFFALYDISRIKGGALYIYLIFMIVLLLTLFFGKKVNGARSWIPVFGGFGLQPSEFAKIATLLFLAKYLDAQKRHIKELGIFIRAFVFTMIPFLLIMAQPDMGSASVYWPIFLFMTFIAGARTRHIMFLVFIGLFTILFTMLPSWEQFILQSKNPLVTILRDNNLRLYVLIALFINLGISVMGLFFYKRTFFYWMIYGFSILIISLLASIAAQLVLKEYQLMRLIVFLDPQVDAKGAGWNVIQSMTAVGSGGLTGKGFLQGTQSHYRFLPQQSTDFIFSILSEELGFMGAVFVFGSFGIILFRALMILTYAKDNYSVNVGAGIIGMIFFHVVINIGMAIGLMPITGIPLFFLSYGGSSLWTALAGIGILFGIYQRRYRN